MRVLSAYRQLVLLLTVAAVKAFSTVSWTRRPAQCGHRRSYGTYGVGHPSPEVASFTTALAASSRDTSSSSSRSQLEAASSYVSSLDDVTSTTAGSQDDTESSESQQQPQLRPLHQNWWPVTTLVALKTDRPNALRALGLRLVAVPDGGEDWHVLTDACPHRFAPLSEGRLVHDEDGGSCSLQCAYHGWEFQASTGACTKVPQDPDRVNKAKGVTTYPTRQAVGLLWVWTDPETVELSETIDLPLDPMLVAWVDQHGGNTGFMRDLPYGAEILGENLLDLSHLPFSHHSVGALQRQDGGELPLRMLSKAEKDEAATWEREMSGNDSVVLPLYQAEVVQAGIHDPAFVTVSRRMGNPPDVDQWKSTAAFYQPCHARYRRLQRPGTTAHVNLFWCPTFEGHSRVFLFNVFEQFLDKEVEPSDDEPEPSRLQRWLEVVKHPKQSFQQWKGKLLLKMIWQRVDPEQPTMHMMSHLIFDGDGIFLHKQGNRMQESGLTIQDYSTPTSADVLVNAYGRFLTKTAVLTRSAGKDAIVDAVMGSQQYPDSEPRSHLLDRYHSHTIHCPVCEKALAQTQAQKRRNQILQTALQGAAGASTTALVTCLALASPLVKTTSTLVPASAFRLLWGVTASTWLASMAAVRKGRKLDKEINGFYFEDYVHADKD